MKNEKTVLVKFKSKNDIIEFTADFLTLLRIKGDSIEYALDGETGELIQWDFTDNNKNDENENGGETMKTNENEKKITVCMSDKRYEADTYEDLHLSINLDGWSFGAGYEDPREALADFLNYYKTEEEEGGGMVNNRFFVEDMRTLINSIDISYEY